MATKVASGAETVEGRDEAVEGVLLDTQSAAVKKLIARNEVTEGRAHLVPTDHKMTGTEDIRELIVTLFRQPQWVVLRSQP